MPFGFTPITQLLETVLTGMEYAITEIKKTFDYF